MQSGSYVSAFRQVIKDVKIIDYIQIHPGGHTKDLCDNGMSVYCNVA